MTGMRNARGEDRWRRVQAIVGVSLCIAGCGHQAERALEALTDAPTGLQAACDSAVLQQTPVEVRLGALAQGQSTPVLTDAVNLRRGGYTPGSGELWVLDPAGPSVVAISAQGREQARFGRSGSGPGDLFVRPWYRPGYNVAVLRDRILVFDAYRLSQFKKDGEFVSVVAYPGSPMGLLPGASLVALSDSTALLGVLQSRMTSDTDFAARTTTRFFVVEPGHRDLELDPLPITLASREWYAGGLNEARVPYYSSFVFQMGETWAVSGGDLFALSFRAFGVCQLDPTRRAVESAVRVAGEPRATTDAERRAVHEKFPGIDDRLPSGVTWGQELDDHWPATAPWYMQIVAGERMIAASRSTSLTEDRIDLFDRTSYLGSFTTSPGWMLQVTAIAGDSLLRVEQDSVSGDHSLTWYHLKDLP